jgi:hypothetical protein
VQDCTAQADSLILRIRHPQALADPGIAREKRADAALAIFHAGAQDVRLSVLVPLVNTLLARLDKCRPA